MSTPLSPTRFSPRQKNKVVNEGATGPAMPTNLSAAVPPSSALPPTQETKCRPNNTTAAQKPRGRGRPPGGSLPPPATPLPANSASINALVAAAETITSEVKYASFVRGDEKKLNQIMRDQEKKAAKAIVRQNNTKIPSSQQQPQQPISKEVPWTHPALADDTSLDSTYADFVRGLYVNNSDGTNTNVLLDDTQSMYTFKTLKVEDAASMEDAVVGTIVGDDITYSVLEEDLDDEDYQLTEEEEEMDSEDEESKAGQSHVSVDTMTRNTKEEEFDLTNLLFGEIEGLLEEDLDAQLTSLMQSVDDMKQHNSRVSTAPATAVVEEVPTNQIAVVGTEEQKAITSPGQTTKKKKSTQTVVTTPTLASPVNTSEAQVTKGQLSRLREAMAKHHQLLLQQATLAVRAAYVQKVSKDHPTRAMMRSSAVGGTTPHGSLPTSMLNSRQLTFCAPGFTGQSNYENDFYHGENAEELAECLDGAVGMLQDLEQNWKDAVRSSIQLSYRNNSAPTSKKGGRRNLMSAITDKKETASDVEMDPNHSQESNNSAERRLTRSAFTKTLQEREMGMVENDGDSSMLPTPSGGGAVRLRNSVFAVRGLARLRETFAAIDNSVKEVRMEETNEGDGDGPNILLPANHGDACELLLRHAGAEVNECLVPGRVDYCDLFTHAPEAFARPDDVGEQLTKAQNYELRKNKNQFTAGEDNLILRGVNLYGEKEWVLVSDRFLPDRPINSISQRYHRLCFLIYKSNGIFIDDDGKLAPLPTFKKGSASAEEEAANRTQEAIRKIKPPAAPTTMNVHRWTMEEDIAILKSVPMMGNQWAEICNHIIPHRDRGHIRKRYQVLERRIPKGTMKLNIKRPATGQLGREVAKYAKTSVMPKSAAAQKSLPSQKKAPPKKGAKPRAKDPKPPQVASAPQPQAAHTGPNSIPHASSFRPLADNHTSSFELDDDDKAAALLHGLATPQRPRQERPLSQDRDAAKDLAYILNGHENSNAGGDTTRLGIEKILENDWSRDSGMERLLDARLAEESKPFHSPIKSSHLPDIAMGDGDSSRLSMLNEFNAAGDDQEETDSTPSARRSLLSNAIRKTEENASKRKSNEASSSSERSVKVSGSPVKLNLGSYVTSPPSRSPSQSPSQDNIFNESFSLAAAYGALTPHKIGTPGKPDTPGLEAVKSNDEAFQYFMSEESPMKSISPSKLMYNGGGLSGPVDGGNNSLFMAGDDEFDCVSALHDLSNSAPSTPSKFLLPSRSQTGRQAEEDEKKESEPPKPKTSFLSKVKAKVGEKK